MKSMSINEFKTKSNIEIIEELMIANNGYVTSKLISEFGIHGMYLNIMKEKGIIEKVGNGIYIDSKKIEDSYFTFNLSLPNVIYSHMTALYFHWLSIKVPDNKCDIIAPNNYFNYKLKNHNIFYVDKEIYNMGLTEIETLYGNKVRVYDIERCIYNIIRSKSRMDLENIKYAIRSYIKRKDRNVNKLLEYAKKLGIKEEVMNYLKIFYE